MEEKMKQFVGSLLVALTLMAASPAQAAKDNDFPTIAIADYVFGCMASNGQSRDIMEKCACSIDLIATQITYQNYLDAETILSMRLVGGEKSAIFKTAAPFKEKVAVLRRAQAEAEILCFH